MAAKQRAAANADADRARKADDALGRRQIDLERKAVDLEEQGRQQRMQKERHDWRRTDDERLARGQGRSGGHNGGGAEKEWELYNLRNDISEKKDVAAEHPELVHELRASWDKWETTLQFPRFPADSPTFPWEELRQEAKQ